VEQSHTERATRGNGPGMSGTGNGRRPPNFKDMVAAELRQRIFQGHLKPGQKIDQDGLADEMGLSKLPVREALIMLEHEGLVENFPRRGSFVAPLTPDDIRDHYRLIAVMSGLAARRAAELISDEELRSLRDLMDKLEATADVSEQEKLNFRFHRVINQVGASHRLRSALALVVNTVPSSFFGGTEWAQHAREEHKRIYAALSAHDPDASEQAVREHITWGAEVAVQHLMGAGFWADATADAVPA
jgi:DNA-binding GntR family transcriptional regulator